MVGGGPHEVNGTDRSGAYRSSGVHALTRSKHARRDAPQNGRLSRARRVNGSVLGRQARSGKQVAFLRTPRVVHELVRVDDRHRLIETVFDIQADPMSLDEMHVPGAGEDVASGLLGNEAELSRLAGPDPLQRSGVGAPYGVLLRQLQRYRRWWVGLGEHQTMSGGFGLVAQADLH